MRLQEALGAFLKASGRLLGLFGWPLEGSWKSFWRLLDRLWGL